MRKINYFLILLITLIITSCSNETELPKNTKVNQISPIMLKSGEEVTIIGSDLDNNPSFVFNGKNLKPSVVTNSTIKLKIPTDAASGELKINFSDVNNVGKSTHKEFFKILDNGWVKNNHNKIPSFTKMEFVNDNIVYATNQSNIPQKRKLYKTIDGGKTWNVVLETPVLHFNFYVADSKVIFARGYENIYKKSVDGGNSWKDIKLLDLKYVIKDITFLNKNVGYLFANNVTKSWIFKTTDGGKNWTKIKEFNKNHASGKFVYGKDSNVYLYDYGSDELILTNDKGTTWQTQKVGVNFFSPKVDFKNDNTAWFCNGIAGTKTLYKTIDSGKTLSQHSMVDLYTNDEIVNFNFLDENKAHIITKDGANFYTLDGGKTWKYFYLDKLVSVSNAFYYKNKVIVFSNGYLYEKTL